MKKEKIDLTGALTGTKAVKGQQLAILKSGVYTENPEIKTILQMMEKLLHWAAIIDSSDDAIISKAVDGTITSWNHGAQRLYGYTPKEIIGKPVSVLMPPEKKDDLPYIMEQLYEGNKVEHYETKRITKDGRIIDVSVTVSPIKDTHGNIIGVSKIARDITERMEMERRREEFVSTASHELKTPLTSQKVFGELLEQRIEQKGYEELKPFITKINKQTDKLARLIEDLLDLSRVNLGKLKMDRRRFDYSELVREIVANTRLTTKHTINLSIQMSNTTIIGDKERLGQVLLNLLSNAVKYSPNAKKINVLVKSENGTILTSVIDYGIGIAKEHQKKLFERFFRVIDDNEKTFPGMGIGLFLSNEIVTRHGGRMWVESAKGKGSTFYFTLPINR